jgi:hypothetical protein
VNQTSQTILTIFVQILIGVAIVATVRQKLDDLVGWVKGLALDVKKLTEDSKQHEGRIARIEGYLKITPG